MNLLDIPHEVITHHFLPNLQLYDLCRLRRVCKVIKGLVDDHIRLNVRSSPTSPQLVISHEDCSKADRSSSINMDYLAYRWISMGTLLQADVHYPATNFFLMYVAPVGNHEGLEFDTIAEKWNISRFLEEYGQQVTRLRISSLCAPMNSAVESNFYESLPNLAHLEVDCLVYRETKGDALATAFPTTFRNLEALCVKQYVDKAVCRKSLVWFGKLVDFCVNLNLLELPFYNFDLEINTSFRFASFILPQLTMRFAALKLNPDQDQRPLQRLKRLELQRLWLLSNGALDATRLLSALCRELVSCAVELRNAPANYIYALGVIPEQEQRDTIEALNKCIVSLYGLNALCFKAELPLLVRLMIWSTEIGCTVEAMEAGPQDWESFGPPAWPSLKVLDVSVNSKKLQDGNDVRRTLLRRVLFGVQRPGVVELYLRFCGEEIVPMPSAAWITWSCFNLRKLFLSSWSGTNRAIVELWKGLPLLEEVCLDGCHNLGNVAFVGEEREKPVFLQLKELKKLSLSNVDQMPKITDTAFKLVFCHLKLDEFELTCSDQTTALTSITGQGIKALLSGEFAETIQRFDFRAWRLADLNEEEFVNLRDQFRSSHLF